MARQSTKSKEQFYFVENNIPVGPFPLDELLTKNITKKKNSYNFIIS